MRRVAVSYTHLRAHETVLDLVCRLQEIDSRNFKKLGAFGLAFRHLASNLYRRNMTLSCVILAEEAVIFIGTKPINIGGRSYNSELKAKA